MRIYKCSVNRTQDYQHASMDAGMHGPICRLSAGGCVMVFVCMHACMRIAAAEVNSVDVTMQRCTHIIHKGLHENVCL